MLYIGKSTNIHVFVNNYYLNTYYAPGIMPGDGNTVVSWADMTAALTE